MKLTQDQLGAYARDGFLILPNLFSPDEVQAMKRDLQRIQDIDTDHLVREKTGGIAKTIYRVHEADGPTASPILSCGRCAICWNRHSNSSTMRNSTSITPSAT